MRNLKKHKTKLTTRLIIFLKNIVWPITPLTVFMAIGVILTIQALIIAFINDHTAAIYASIMIPITIFIIILYIIDRLLIGKLPYYILVLMELLMAIIIYFSFTFNNRTIDINFHTNQDFILVIFDSEYNLISDFRRSGIFGKELHVYNNNIIHVDSLLSLKKNLRINKPKEWKGFSQDESRLNVNGHSIKYIFSSKNNFDSNYIKNPSFYIDSLLNHTKSE